MSSPATGSSKGKVVVVGGTSAIGQAIAAHYAQKGHSTFLTSRSDERATKAAEEVGCMGFALDLMDSQEIISETVKKTVGDDVQYLILVAVVRNMNTIVKDYNAASATELVLVKTVGYQKVIHALLPHMRTAASICLMGGMAKDSPYPGSTMVTTANGAVHSAVHTLAIELGKAYKNIRVNGLHPGLVSDSPNYVDKPAVVQAFAARTPLENMVKIDDVVHATAFLLENKAMTGVNLPLTAGMVLA